MAAKRSTPSHALRFRPLAVMDLSMKQHGQWFRRLSKDLMQRDLPENVFGFIRGRQAAEMMLIRQLVMEKLLEFRERFYSCKF